jgi:hypothetical protein
VGDWNEWDTVAYATTPISSGLAVVEAVPEHFHLFAAGQYQELRHAEFDHGWLPVWDDLGNFIEGTPVVRMGQEARLDVFAASSEGDVAQLLFADGQFHGWFGLSSARVNSLSVASWGNDRIDLFARNADGELSRLWYSLNWVSDWIASGHAMPSGESAAIATRPGTLDVLVAQPGGSLWHAFWPRSPEPD